MFEKPAYTSYFLHSGMDLLTPKVLVMVQGRMKRLFTFTIYPMFCTKQYKKDFKFYENGGRLLDVETERSLKDTVYLHQFISICI